MTLYCGRTGVVSPTGSDGTIGVGSVIDGGTNGIGGVPGATGVVGILPMESLKSRSRIVHFLTLPPGKDVPKPSGVMLGSNLMKNDSSPSISLSL